MSKQLINPWFILLLPLFFVLHVCAENPGLVPLTLSSRIYAEFLVAAIILYFLFYFIVKDNRKAALLGSFVLSFDLFFGSFHDSLKIYFNDTLFVKYSVLISLFLVALLLFIILLKRRKVKVYRLCMFLNILLLLFILIDIIKLVTATSKRKAPVVMNLESQLTVCDTCTKPDIYMIIADGYPGDSVLQNYFSYDNSAFTSTLNKKGFHVVSNAKSNYNYTVYTLASMLNMDYIQSLDKDQPISQQSIYMSRDHIQKNNFTQFLEANGYVIENFSFLTLEESEGKSRLPYFPPRRALFTSQTFINRFTKSAGYNIPFFSKYFYHDVHNEDYYNNLMDSLCRKSSTSVNAKPRFIFTHLMLPHHPYFYDSTGNYVNPEGKYSDSLHEKQDFIQYLVYSNKKLISLVDHILSTSKTPPIILLMSDHGYRKFPDKAYKEFQFSALNSVYFPDRNYSGFYTGMSTVNELRVVLNSQFRQKLPMLKDSTCFFNLHR